MKKACCLFLCLLLALAAPLSGLTEPQSWLLPFTKHGDTVQSGQAAVTVKIDPEAVSAAVDWYYDIQLKSYDELAKTANLHFDIEDLKRPLSAARAAAKAYVPAAAVLADSAEIRIQSGEGLTCCILQVNGAPWFTLNLIARPEEDTLLTSDLFPACAVSLPQNDSLTSGLSGDSAEAYQTLMECWQELLPMLPEFVGFDLLGQSYAAAAQTMAFLEAGGSARREGDKLIYDAEGPLTADGDILANDPMDGLFSRHELDVDERLYRLYTLFARLGREALARNMSSSADFWQEEGAADTLPVLSEDATDADYTQAVTEYLRLWYANEVKTTSVRQHTVLENGTFTLEYTTTETTHHEVKGDAETIRKLMERYETLADREQDEETASTTALLLTPTWTEFRFTDDYGDENSLRLDTGAENEILFTYTRPTVGLELLLTRTEEGQQWILTIPLDTLTGEENADPIRMTVSMDNDVRWMTIALNMLGMELGVIRAEYTYSEEPAPVPDVSGLTVIPSDDPEALQALAADLRAVGIPQLTRLIATGLPDGAQGIIVPLLGLVTSLAQIGQ